MDKWRLILDPDLPGALNMAVDEALLRAAELESGGGPVLRLYGWVEPAISIGYAQDPAPLASKGIPVVRRITGGRAVLHDNEITYSITAPCAHPLFSGGITHAYSVISGCIIAALGDAGVRASMSRARTRGDARGRTAACFHTPSRCEVLVGGRKLVGSSQRRFKNAFLQHGSILYAIDQGLNERVFGPGLIERMACVSSCSSAGKEDLRRLLVKRFSEGLGVEFMEGGLTQDEAAGVARALGSRGAPPEGADTEASGELAGRLM
ncbi:MAG: biotin/lipoate A/B protein ligase family protein [Thermodesulfobacteriota bacterium]